MENETNIEPVSEVSGEQQEVVDTSIVEEQQVQPEVPETKEDRQVPLSALEAERRRRQEAEAENRVYQQLARQPEQTKEEDEDEDDWVTKKRYQDDLKNIRREVSEETFVTTNPDAYRQIKDRLPGLIEKKPWVEEVIKNAPNRWQRAWELLNDLSSKEQQKPQPQRSQDAERIVQNANKPGSPTSIGKSATMSKVEYMRSIRGSEEWDKYRSSLVK